MKRLLMAVVMVFVLNGWAWADYFQFMFRENQYYASYAAVFINGKRVGYTDKYGRIAIDLPDGTYSATIRQRGRSVQIGLTIDGSRYLKLLYLD